jgi:hypothetical protein
MNNAFLTLFVFILFIQCNNAENEDRTYHQHRERIEQQEKSNPLSFLKITADNKKNIFGRTVTSGTITNTAMFSLYKNVRVKMLCYRGRKQIEEHEDVVIKEIEPGTIKKFKTRYKLPKGTDSIAVSIINAEL